MLWLSVSALAREPFDDPLFQTVPCTPRATAVVTRAPPLPPAQPAVVPSTEGIGWTAACFGIHPGSSCRAVDVWDHVPAGPRSDAFLRTLPGVALTPDGPLFGGVAPLVVLDGAVVSRW